MEWKSNCGNEKKLFKYGIFGQALKDDPEVFWGLMFQK